MTRGTTRRAALASLAGAACRSRSERRLNVCNWSNYVAPETIPGFERETGIRVRYAIYESNEEMMAKVLSGNSGWDVVFPSNYYIAPMAGLNLLAPIERRRLGNLGNLDQGFARPPWDPELRWCVPYMWGSTGIVVHPRLGLTPRRWADLWDPRMQGKLTMLDDPMEVLGACLKKLGRSLNSTDESELLAAKQEALKQRGLLRAYLNAEVRDQVVAGDVLCAQMWATTAQQARRGNPALTFVYPEEGFGLYADCAVILRESRRREAAHEFIDYLLRAEVAARVIAVCDTATANGVARRLSGQDSSADTILYPDTETMQRGEWFGTMPARVQRLRDRLWTEIKSA